MRWIEHLSAGENYTPQTPTPLKFLQAAKVSCTGINLFLLNDCTTDTKGRLGVRAAFNALNSAVH